MRKLVIVEPWVCHYEIFPSILHVAQKIYQSIDIYVQSRDSLMANYKNISNHIKIQNLSRLINDARSAASNNIELDIWVNTTHVHGNSESFNAYQSAYRSMADNNLAKNIYIVIHNKHDVSFLKKLEISTSVNIYPICLSQDTMYKYLPHEKNAELFEPFTLHISEDNQRIHNTYIKNSDAINLLILGMCREGKKFRELRYFLEDIKTNSLTFSFCGWTPQGSIKPSGLFYAINHGLIDKLESSKIRVEDSIINNMISNCDALIDLKMIEQHNSYVSSGNISASVSMQKPLIAHQKNYPSFNCIRYNSYTDLIKMLRNKEIFLETLNFHAYLLKKERDERLRRCSEFFRHRL